MRAGRPRSREAAAWERGRPARWSRAGASITLYSTTLEIQKLVDENCKLLRQDPGHPSLHFKKVGKFRSVRVGIHYRAVGIAEGSDIVLVLLYEARGAAGPTHQNGRLSAHPASHQATR